MSKGLVYQFVKKCNYIRSEKEAHPTVVLCLSNLVSTHFYYDIWYQSRMQNFLLASRVDVKPPLWLQSCDRIISDILA